MGTTTPTIYGRHVWSEWSFPVATGKDQGTTINGSESRGFGFVTMETPEEADAAVALDGTELGGKVIGVEKARRRRARTPTPGRYYGPPKMGDDECPYGLCPHDSRYSCNYGDRGGRRGGGRYNDYRGWDDYRIPTSCAAEEGMTTTAGTIIGGTMTIGIAGDAEGGAASLCEYLSLHKRSIRMLYLTAEALRDEKPFHLIIFHPKVTPASTASRNSSATVYDETRVAVNVSMNPEPHSRFRDCARAILNPFLEDMDAGGLQMPGDYGRSEKWVLEGYFGSI
ncbi:hypothetical protein B0H13DRAFT_1851950 [Mycena leptocephala]|nr:hypothetical protein B0H13DRAFT_1851950 [Mycena leptocephala]